MSFNGFTCPAGFVQPVIFIRGCTLVTAVKERVLYSDGLQIFSVNLSCDNSVKGEEDSRKCAPHILQLVFLDGRESITKDDPIITLYTIQGAPRECVAMATLCGDVYIAELTENRLNIALLYRTSCYGPKAIFTGTFGTQVLLCIICPELSRLFLFNISDASLIAEIPVDVDIPLSGALFENCLYIVCRTTLISFFLLSSEDSSISLSLNTFIRLPLNGSYVICARFVPPKMFLLGLNTRQVCASNTEGMLVSIWCKVSKYEPLYVINTPESDQLERIVIAAVSNEVVLHQRNVKEKSSEFRTDGLIIGYAETDTYLIFLTERTIYFYLWLCKGKGESNQL